MLAGLLLKGMHHRWPQAKAQGIGGPRMVEHGFEAWWPHERLAVRGYVEVLRHYRGIQVLHHGMHDALRMNHHFNLRWFQAEQVLRLNDFQRLVHHGGGID